MPKKYNTPHRSRVVKTRMTEEEYADFTERLQPYDMSQSEFIRQAISRAVIRPIVTDRTVRQNRRQPQSDRPHPERMAQPLPGYGKGAKGRSSRPCRLEV